MEPIIGITADSTYENNRSYPEPHQINYSPRDLTKAVIQAGGIPILIPINEPDVARKYGQLIDGLILAGGSDISPSLYHEEPRVGIKKTHPRRDAAEVALAEEMMERGKPILGICRGLQLINAMFGGSLYQDLNENESITLKHIQDTDTHHPTHSVTVENNTYLNSFLANEFKVNSLHHQIIRDLGQGLAVAARSDDGVIEAIESIDDHTSVIGVQWHPESLYSTFKEHLALFEDLIFRAEKPTIKINNFVR